MVEAPQGWPGALATVVKMPQGQAPPRDVNGRVVVHGSWRGG